MRTMIAGLALAALLMGCGQAVTTTEEQAAQGGEGYVAATDAITRGMVDAPAAEAPAPADADVAQGQPPTEQAIQQANEISDRSGRQNPAANPAPTLFLAYSYNVGLELPAANLTGVVNGHVQACQTAGPRVCQLIGSSVSGDPESAMNGYVSFRAEPAWLATFRNGLEAQADAAGGRILQNTTNTEDLTRAIVDTEARLRAQTALRDRLQRLLESRPGRLSDLLEVERELARVQGEIDSVQSTLAVMRTRVAMSELTLNYQSAPKSLRSDTFRPLGQAFANFLGIVVSGFAAIVTIIAGLIPFAVVIIPLIWLILRWRTARGGRFFGRKQKTPAAASDG